MTALTNYLEQYALIAMEHQDKFSELVGEHTYELDLESGKMRFNDNFEFSYQVLGTESDNTLIWLWAWAEEQTEEIPENLLQASRQLRTWGQSQGVSEFTLPSLDLNRADGHVLSMIATEVCGASCYYRDAYEGGAAFVLIFDKRIDAQPSFDRARLFRRFLDLISHYELNHRKVLRSYLGIKGLSSSETDSMIHCELESGEQLSAEFDKAGRLLLFNKEIIAP